MVINVVFKFGPVELMVGLYIFELTSPVGLKGKKLSVKTVMLIDKLE
jgi:hypothetical protein